MNRHLAPHREGVGGWLVGDSREMRLHLQFLPARPGEVVFSTTGSSFFAVLAQLRHGCLIDPKPACGQAFAKEGSPLFSRWS